MNGITGQGPIMHDATGQQAAPAPMQGPTPQVPQGAAQQPTDIDNLIQMLMGRTPAVLEREALERMGGGQKGWRNALFGVKELGNAFTQGLRNEPYKNPKQRAREEALSEFKTTAPILEQLLNTKAMSDYRAGMHSVAQQNADTKVKDLERKAIVDAIKADIAQKKLTTVDQVRVRLDQEIGKGRIGLMEAQAALAEATANLRDSQTELTQTKTQNEQDTRGLKSIEGLTNIGMGMKDEDWAKLISKNRDLQKNRALGQRPLPDYLRMNIDQNAQYWDPKERKIVNKPRGYAYRALSGNLKFLGDWEGRKLTNDELKGLEAGKLAENTVGAMASTLADSYASGRIKAYKGPVRGQSVMQTLRRMGVTGSFTTDEAMANVLTPTGMLQHMRQLTGGRVTDSQLKHFQHTLGVEEPSTPEAAIRNAIALKLATQHNNDVLGGHAGPGDFNVQTAETLRKHVDEYIKSLKTVAQYKGVVRPKNVPDMRDIFEVMEKNDAAENQKDGTPSGIRVGK